MYSSTLPSTSALDGGGWSTPRPGHFTHGKEPVPIVWEAGWAPGPVWTGAENLAPIGIRSPDHQARNESLYRLSYPGPVLTEVHLQKSRRRDSVGSVKGMPHFFFFTLKEQQISRRRFDHPPWSLLSTIEKKLWFYILMQR